MSLDDASTTFKILYFFYIILWMILITYIIIGLMPGGILFENIVTNPRQGWAFGIATLGLIYYFIMIPCGFGPIGILFKIKEEMVKNGTRKEK